MEVRPLRCSIVAVLTFSLGGGDAYWLAAQPQDPIPQRGREVNDSRKNPVARPQPRSQRGQATRPQGEIQQLTQQINNSWKDPAARAELYFQRGQAFIRQGDYEKAIADFRASPPRPEVRLAL